MGQHSDSTAASPAIHRAERVSSGRRAAPIVGVVGAVPLVVLAVVVLIKPWVPVLDLAMTELRLRDVGTRHTPLIGLPGRIGNFPDQGSHAGPAYFYVIGIIYRLTGTRAVGMEFASVVVNLSCLATGMWLAWRRFAWKGATGAALVGVFLVRYYGSVVLAQPWNPYFPVLVWALGVFAAVLVFSGWRSLTPLVVATATIAAQTHVPYLTPSVALCGAVLVYLLWRRDSWRPILWGLLTAAVLWLPPLVDQLRRDPGNLKMMFDHFTAEHCEPAIGLVHSLKVVTQHLDIVGAAIDLFSSRTPAIDRASDITSFSPVGLLVLAGWIGAAVWVIVRRRAAMYPLFGTAALLLVVDWVSISRIFGKVWFYLTLWMPTTALLVWIGLGWVAVTVYRNRRSDQVSHPTTRARSYALWAAGAIVVIVGAISLSDVARYRVPEQSQGEPVGALMPELVAQLDGHHGDTSGHDGRYLIYWQEAVFSGSQGLALVNELDRRNYEVGVPDTWRVPATTHRVLPAERATTELHLVSGVWIERTEERGQLVKLVEVDTRTDAQRTRFDTLHTRAAERLDEIGRADLVPALSDSIFKLSLDDSLPADIRSDIDEMVEIGVPVAVFAAPVGTGLEGNELPRPACDLEASAVAP